MGYFDMFQNQPAVAKSDVKEQPMAQQQLQFAPPPPSQPSTTDQLKSQGMSMGMDQAQNYLTEEGPGLLAKGKDFLGFGAAAPTVGTAVAPAVASPLATAGSAFVTPGASVGATTAASGAASGAAGAGMGAALGAAAPWLIGGYFGGKALGLFNKGGKVDEMHIGGMINMPGPLSGIRYKYKGGEVTEEMEVKYGPLGG